MVSEFVTVVNKMGFHMRPASTFVKEMGHFSSNITIFYNGHIIDGKSIMNVMASCIKCGARLELQCTGPDEDAMLTAALDLIEHRLGDAD